MTDFTFPPLHVPPRELENAATAFLAEFNPQGTIPVPIEEIVEFGLGLDIIPVPRLYKDFRLDGWISVGAKAIHVDQTQLEQFETRYRFTLAHEVSHLLLHRGLLTAPPFNSMEGWCEFYLNADENRVNNYEWQARNLAGRILVPRAPLIEKGIVLLQRIPAELLERATRDEVLRSLSLPLGDEFNVHPGVVEIRLIGDRVGADILEARR